MLLISLGLLLWIFVHLFPSLAPGARNQLVARMGLNPYKGIFSLLIIAGVLLIVLGWRATDPVYFYHPPPGMRHGAMLLVVIGFILMVAASFPKTRIKRFLRHPQLTGVLLWAIAHLFVNGDSRSLLVFGSIAAWCVVSMLLINRRDGAWIKPAVVQGWGREALIPVIGIALSLLVVRFHQYLSGIPLVG
jgi:uncharacterized membrane protein